MFVKEQIYFGLYKTFTSKTLIQYFTLLSFICDFECISGHISNVALWIAVSDSLVQTEVSQLSDRLRMDFSIESNVFTTIE